MRSSSLSDVKERDGPIVSTYSQNLLKPAVNINDRGIDIDLPKKPKLTPVNVITGFLGVGKTSAILSLLKQKPDAEQWAILVNEFGEIGVDRGLIKGQSARRDDVMVFEVPGGCMCCAAGLPMEMALSQIFFLGEPDRLIIEPTGLGHPAEVLTVLATDHYQRLLELRTTVALVDARAINEAQHRNHPSFIQQLAVADLVLANKADLVSEPDLGELRKYLDHHCAANVAMHLTEYGSMSLDLLDDRSSWSQVPNVQHHPGARYTSASDGPIPDSGFLRATNTGEGYTSQGWRVSAEKVFSYVKVVSFLKGLKAERIKAVLITDAGIFGYNISGPAFSEILIDDCMESRLEIIATESDSRWEKALMECLVAR